MERTDDNQDSTDDGSNSKNDINLDNEFGIKYDVTPKILETNSSIASPLIPSTNSTNETK